MPWIYYKDFALRGEFDLDHNGFGGLHCIGAHVGSRNMRNRVSMDSICLFNLERGIGGKGKGYFKDIESSYAKENPVRKFKCQGI